MKRLTWIVIGAAIGLVIGGLIFGFLSWQQIGEVAKVLK